MSGSAVFTLVLLPGLDGTGELFAPFIAALPAGTPTRVVRYPASTALDYDACEVHARAALPNNAPYLLLAESFSGPIALRIAAARPAGLRGVILCASFARAPRPRWCVPPVWLCVSMMRSPLAARLALGADAPLEIRHVLRSVLRTLDGETVRARLAAALNVDATDALARIDVPLLYLRASRDWLVPREAGAAIAAACARAALREIQGPHFLLQAAPAACAREVAAFAEAICAPP